jgi:DNA polymerase (family 10)
MGTNTKPAKTGSSERIGGLLMTNSEVARIFGEIAEMLELKDENRFKVRSYQRVSQLIESLPQDIAEVHKAGKLEELPGVGEAIAKKIAELVETGRLGFYERLKAEIPPGLLDMLKIPDVGPRTVQLVNRKLGITTVDELEKAARDHRIRELDRMGPKVEENILKGIELVRGGRERITLGRCLPLALFVVERLKSEGVVEAIQYAGSLRRMKETIGDIDMLAVSKDPASVMEAFTSMGGIKRIIEHGETRSSVIFGDEEVQMDLRVVPAGSFGAALQYFTGSKEHNVRLREIAVKKGMKLNEYGLFKVTGKKETPVAGTTEEEIYEALGMAWMPPEMREDRGEIDAAIAHALPKLVTEADIRGDLHMHTKWTDGRHSIAEMAEAARAKGRKYIAICDHSQSLTFVNGLKKSDLLRQWAEIEELNSRFKGFRILKGSEVDILGDGRLDYEDEFLRRLEIVVASVHTGWKDDREKMTARVVKAISSGMVDIVAHPTGRWLGQREPYDIDMERVLAAAKEHRVALELNSSPERLDLNDVWCRRAKELGVKISIDTDSHATFHLDWMKLGVATARRGWLEPKDVLNCGDVGDVIGRRR